MEDPEIYGDTFHLLTFKAALECDPPILSDYQVITIGVRESEVARHISSNAYIKPEDGKWSVVTAQTFASLVALQKAIAQNGVKHAVSFHSSIARAKQFKHFFDGLPASGDTKPAVASFHVSGAMPTSTRDAQVRAFLDTAPSLLTNARCLTEGVDVPEIDCILFADPKTSKVDIVQACGRALRLSDGKQLGHIIVPCVVVDGASVEQIRQSVAFIPGRIPRQALQFAANRFLQSNRGGGAEHQHGRIHPRYRTRMLEQTRPACVAALRRGTRVCSVFAARRFGGVAAVDSRPNAGKSETAR
jgi:predicted helicase